MVKRRNNERAKAMRREKTIRRKRAAARIKKQPMDSRGKRIKIPKGFLIIPNTKAPIRSLPKKLLKSINAKEFLLKVTKESEPRNDKK
jgi:hypothetical protein